MIGHGLHFNLDQLTCSIVGRPVKQQCVFGKGISCCLLSVQLKVTHKHLVLLQEAFAAYFSCNHEALEALRVHFQDKIEESGGSNDPPTWLEDLPSQNNQSQ